MYRFFGFSVFIWIVLGFLPVFGILAQSGANNALTIACENSIIKGKTVKCSGTYENSLKFTLKDVEAKIESKTSGICDANSTDSAKDIKGGGTGVFTFDVIGLEVGTCEIYVNVLASEVEKSVQIVPNFDDFREKFQETKEKIEKLRTENQTELDTTQTFFKELDAEESALQNATTNTNRQAVLEKIDALDSTAAEESQTTLKNKLTEVKAAQEELILLYNSAKTNFANETGFANVQTVYNEGLAESQSFINAASRAIFDEKLALQNEALNQILYKESKHSEFRLFPTWGDINKAFEDPRTVNVPGVDGKRNDGNLIITLFPRIASLLIQLAVPLVLVGVLYMGIMLITGTDGDEALTKVKEYAPNLILGVILMTLAFTLVQAIYFFFVQ